MNNENQYIALARHAIGLDHKKPYKRHGKLFYRPYRNYYDASPKDCETWELMCDAGYADRGRKDRYGGRMYWLTRKGLDWLGEKLGIKIYDEEDQKGVANVRHSTQFIIIASNRRKFHISAEQSHR